MRRLVLIIISVVFIVFIFSSCREYVCECTNGTDTFIKEYEARSKSEMEDDCFEYEASLETDSMSFDCELH